MELVYAGISNVSKQMLGFLLWWFVRPQPWSQDRGCPDARRPLRGSQVRWSHCPYIFGRLLCWSLFLGCSSVTFLVFCERVNGSILEFDIFMWPLFKLECFQRSSFWRRLDQEPSRHHSREALQKKLLLFLSCCIFSETVHFVFQQRHLSIWNKAFID